MVGEGHDRDRDLLLFAPLSGSGAPSRAQFGRRVDALLAFRLRRGSRVLRSGGPARPESRAARVYGSWERRRPRRTATAGARACARSLSLFLSSLAFLPRAPPVTTPSERGAGGTAGAAPRVPLPGRGTPTGRGSGYEGYPGSALLNGSQRVVSPRGLTRRLRSTPGPAPSRRDRSRSRTRGAVDFRYARGHTTRRINPRPTLTITYVFLTVVAHLARRSSRLQRQRTANRGGAGVRVRSRGHDS